MTRFIDIAPLDDIPRDGARVVKTPQGCIAVFRTADDRVFALDDRCPHKGGPLSEGIVHGGQVTCPLHAMVFDLATGLATGLAQDADAASVRVHGVQVRDGRVLLEAAFLTRRTAA